MTTESRQASCEERIGEYLAGRLQDFRDFIALEQARVEDDYSELGVVAERHDIDPEAPDVEDRIMEVQDNYPLAVSVQRVVRIDLSTGGPGDWIEAQVDEDGNVDGRITYHFNDWFDHAERTLEGEEYEAAETFVERFSQGL